MVGRGVSYSTTGIAPSTAVADDDRLGRRQPRRRTRRSARTVTANTDVYNNVGTKVPLHLAVHAHRRRLDGAGVERRDRRSASPQNVTFDATGERTSADFTMPACRPRRPRRHDRHLAADRRHARDWAPRPIRTASRWAAGTSKMAVLEQNGGDGTSLTGIVTGMHITADGPQLAIDGQRLPLASVTEVQAPAL